MKIRSRSSNTWVYVLLGGLVLLGGVLSVGSWTVWLLVSEERTQLVLTSEALKDRWFAISKISERYGVTVHSNAQLDVEDMPALSDTIILSDVRSSEVDESVNTQLENWILRGGTLIYRVPVVHTNEDPLSVINTNYFPNKLMVFEEREPSKFGTWTNWYRQSPWKTSCESATLSIQFVNGDTASLAPKTPSSPQLVTSKSPFAEDIETLSRMYFLKMKWGLGTVYFVTDLDLWANQLVDCADHAYVFLRLVRGSIDPFAARSSEIAVWIVPREPVNTPHLLNLVWDNYHVPLIGILVTFLVALIARNIRSSPAMHAIPIPRRATIDYVTSVTEFAWRKKDIRRFFRALQWVSDNPKGVFGPSKGPVTENSTEMKNIGTSDILNHSRETEADLVDNVRRLQATLRQNMQPSLRKS